MSVDVDSFIDEIESVAPSMWEHVCKLTQSVNESKGRSAAINQLSLI